MKSKNPIIFDIPISKPIEIKPKRKKKTDQEADTIPKKQKKEKKVYVKKIKYGSVSKKKQKNNNKTENEIPKVNSIKPPHKNPHPIRKPRTAWVIFVMNEKEKSNFPLHSVLSNLGPIWKKMTIEEKEPYEQLAKEDLERYYNERKNLTKEEKKVIRSNRKKIRKQRENNLKKPLTSYMMFMQKNRSLFVSENPEASVPEIATLVGEKWKLLSEEERSVYQKLAKEAKMQYNELQENLS